MPELEYATLTELVEELRGRCRVLFLALRPEDARAHDILFNVKGDIDTAVGLAERVKALVIEANSPEVDNSSEAGSDEEAEPGS